MEEMFEMVQKVFWAHGSVFAKLNVKQTAGTGSEQHISRAVSNAKLQQTMCDSGYFDGLPPLVIFVQLCKALPQHLGQY